MLNVKAKAITDLTELEGKTIQAVQYSRDRDGLFMRFENNCYAYFIVDAEDEELNLYKLNTNLLKYQFGLLSDADYACIVEENKITDNNKRILREKGILQRLKERYPEEQLKRGD